MSTRVSFTEVRRERKCLGCRTNKHYDCDLHLNDGAGDAEDFITVRCDCPCEGDVREKGRGLIGLVGDLRASLVQLNLESTERIGALNASVREHVQTIAALQEALDSRYDDEGNFVG